DDHPGGTVRRHSADAGERFRRGAAPAAGPGDGGRTAGEPSADAVHHTGDLPVVRPAVPAPDGAQCGGGGGMNGKRQAASGELRRSGLVGEWCWFGGLRELARSYAGWLLVGYGRQSMLRPLAPTLAPVGRGGGLCATKRQLYLLTPGTSNAPSPLWGE